MALSDERFLMIGAVFFFMAVLVGVVMVLLYMAFQIPMGRRMPLPRMALSDDRFLMIVAVFVFMAVLVGVVMVLLYMAVQIPMGRRMPLPRRPTYAVQRRNQRTAPIPRRQRPNQINADRPALPADRPNPPRRTVVQDRSVVLLSLFLHLAVLLLILFVLLLVLVILIPGPGQHYSDFCKRK
ncbi:uncharacterized protein LOC144163052 [Haemaphysalis longicornis]